MPADSRSNLSPFSSGDSPALRKPPINDTSTGHRLLHLMLRIWVFGNCSALSLGLHIVNWICESNLSYICRAVKFKPLRFRLSTRSQESPRQQQVCVNQCSVMFIRVTFHGKDEIRRLGMHWSSFQLLRILWKTCANLRLGPIGFCPWEPSTLI